MIVYHSDRENPAKEVVPDALTPIHHVSPPSHSTRAQKRCICHLSTGTWCGKGRDGEAHKAAPVLRRTMNDVADGLLLDVREISITDLEFAAEDSALDRALQRILTSNTDCGFSSFNSSI